MYPNKRYNICTIELLDFLKSLAILYYRRIGNHQHERTHKHTHTHTQKKEVRIRQVSGLSPSTPPPLSARIQLFGAFIFSRKFKFISIF